MQNKFLPFALTGFALLFVTKLLSPEYGVADRTGFRDTNHRGSFQSGVVVNSSPTGSTVEAKDYGGARRFIEIAEQINLGKAFGPFSVKDQRILNAIEQDDRINPSHPR